MSYNSEKELKLYYSISEVAEMFGVPESLLRYWEKSFRKTSLPRKPDEESDNIGKKILKTSASSTTW